MPVQEILLMASAGRAASGGGGGGGGTGFRSVSTIAVAVSQNSVTVDKPPGTSDQDLVWAAITVEGAGLTVTPPSGEGFTLETSYDNTSTGLGHFLFYKIADSSEPADYQFTVSGSATNLAAFTAAYQGFDTTDPVHATAAWVDSGGFVTTHNSDTLTTSVATWVLSFGYGFRFPATGGTWVPDSSDQERLDDYGGSFSGLTAQAFLADSDGAVAAGSITRTHTSTDALWSSLVLIGMQLP